MLRDTAPGRESLGHCMCVYVALQNGGIAFTPTCVMCGPCGDVGVLYSFMATALGTFQLFNVAGLTVQSDDPILHVVNVLGFIVFKMPINSFFLPVFLLGFSFFSC